MAGNIIAGLLGVTGVALVVWLARQVLGSSRRLDERIEQYREEGPPRDPFGELARIMAEIESSKRHGGPMWFERFFKRRRNTGQGEGQ